MITYNSSSHYLQSCTSIQAKITAIDAIVEALLLTAAKAAANDDIDEYWLNDGQTVIKTRYKGTASVMRSIEAFERLRVYYTNRLTGRMVRLVDTKNFTGNGSYRY